MVKQMRASGSAQVEAGGDYMHWTMKLYRQAHHACRIYPMSHEVDYSIMQIIDWTKSSVESTEHKNLRSGPRCHNHGRLAA